MEIGFINSCLKKDLFPYYMRKYPQSEESQVNWSLTKNLNEVDNFESNNNDEVFWSKVKFQYTESQDYNDEIMKFLNYIIGLPNQEM